ncbi:MAG TPA: hypothetical protein VL068_04430, partial [Microthrixaceae bacterium]|nr:hypothetical protein [Microthrixaceae bacterium]
YLDEPFRSTGLDALYADSPNMYQLPGFYLEIDGIDNFLTLVGATASIEIVQRTDLWQNPKFDRSWTSGKNENFNTVRRDWDIRDFDEIIHTEDSTLLSLMWTTISCAPADKAVAVYKANASNSPHEFDSFALQSLTTAAWIPADDGELKRPQNVTLEQLPAGWAMPPDGSLASALPFGTNAAKQTQQDTSERDYAKHLGFDPELFELVKEAHELGIGQSELRQLIENKQNKDTFPEGPSIDPDRRSAVAALDATTAATHQTDIRSRSVVVGQAQSSQESRSYLREQYTDGDGVMYCQACHEVLPFRVKGGWYFQATQFIGNRKRVHHQNALALCPLCAALYRHKRETTDPTVMLSLAALEVEKGDGTIEIPVLLNGQVARIRLTGKHALDIQAAMLAAGESRDED